MRSARIRTAWKNKRRAISTAEHASAVAAAAWRIALNAAKNLHAQDYVYGGDEQRLGVMREYLCFFIHFADRVMHTKLDDARRTEFTTALSHECARHYLENERDIQTPTATAAPFIAHLNQRLDGYATTRFTGGKPGYATYRALALHIRDCLGQDQTNKWALEQVLDIDAPEALRIFERALTGLNRAVDSQRQEESTVILER